MPLPPGLEGYVLADQQRGQKEARQLGMLGSLAQLQNHAMEQQLLPLKVQQLKLAVQKAQTNADLIRQLQGQMTGGGALGALSAEQSAGGAPGPTVAASQRIPQSGGGMLNAPGIIQAMLLSGDSGLSGFAKAHLEQNKPMAAREGAPVINPATGQVVFFAPKLEPGMVPNYQGGQLTGVSNAPGYIPSMTERDEARERSKAKFDVIDVKMPDGSVQQMSRSAYLQQQGRPQLIPRAVDYSSRPPAEQAAIDTVLRASQEGRGATVTVPNGAIPTSAVVGRSQTPADKVRAETLAKGEAEKALERPQTELRTTTQLDDLQRLSALAQEIMKDPALGRSVGLAGAFPSIPGNPAANADALIDSLKAQVSGMKLQAMRDASKTGGAVGQVTEREWPRLENMITALDKKMSPEKFREKLSELVFEIGKSQQSISRAYQGETGTTMTPRPAAQEARSYPTPSQKAIGRLKMRPSEKAQFEAIFGPGSASGYLQ